MDELVWVAVLGVVALVPPVRRRLPPVAKAMLAAGLSTAAAALRGVEGIVVAAANGEEPDGDEAGTPNVRGSKSMGAASKRRPRADTKPL